MEGLAKGTRGLWARAGAKADITWGSHRNEADVAARRAKLMAKVTHDTTRPNAQTPIMIVINAA